MSAVTNIFQPSTTDNTPEGFLRARNSMRLRLWADDALAHQWLCHEGRECVGGCDNSAEPSRLALYESDCEYDHQETEDAGWTTRGHGAI